MEGMVASWENDFLPVQREVETGLYIISSGKTIRQPMRLEKGNSVTGLNIRNGISSRRANSQSSSLRPSPSIGSLGAPPMQRRISSNPSPSSSSVAVVSPPLEPEDNSPSTSGYPTPSSTAYSPAAPRSDYFSRDRTQLSTSLSNASAIAAKKKPPPPPPPKTRLMFVTAMYSFQGQSPGDLSF